MSPPTDFATPSPNKIAPKIAKIEAKIRICFILRILDPYKGAIVSSFAPIPIETITDIIRNIIIITAASMLSSTLFELFSYILFTRIFYD